MTAPPLGSAPADRRQRRFHPRHRDPAGRAKHTRDSCAGRTKKPSGTTCSTPARTNCPGWNTWTWKNCRQNASGSYFESHGMFDRVMWTLHNRDSDHHLSRLFICQFGYLDSDRPWTRRKTSPCRLRDESAIPVSGYSNDVSSDLLVYAAGRRTGGGGMGRPGRHRLSPPAPPTPVPYAHRLYGTVESTEGTFEGFIQWDQSECTSIDILDGDNREIPMGDIRSITRNGKGNADLVLKNGEAFTMTGPTTWAAATGASWSKTRTGPGDRSLETVPVDHLCRGPRQRDRPRRLFRHHPPDRTPSPGPRARPGPAASSTTWTKPGPATSSTGRSGIWNTTSPSG